MNEKQARNELSTQDTSTNTSQDLIKEKRKQQIYKFLQSYVVSRALKIFVHFEHKTDMSKVFKEVIENKYEMAHDNQGSKRIEVDI